MKVNTDRIKKIESTENKINEMLKLTFENSEEADQRQKASLNLYFFE